MVLLTVELCICLDKFLYRSTDDVQYAFAIFGSGCDDVPALMDLHGDAIGAKGWQRKENELSTAMLVPPTGCTVAEAKALLTQTCGCTFVKIKDPDTEMIITYELKNKEEPAEPVGKLLHDNLADDPTSDFMLIDCDDNEFKVHKCVLRTRSSVLLRLFANEPIMQEDDDLKQGRMRMAEAGSSALQAFVCALYTNEYKLKYSQDPDSVQQLLKLADMYDVQDLKRAIESDLVASVNYRNGRQLAVIADRFNMDALLQNLFRPLEHN